MFKGLKALAKSSFPKKCRNCGRIFETAEVFLFETEAVGKSNSGLKEGEDDDGNKIIEIFRNCSCGSTLMDFFGDRRDMSEAGMERRERFKRLLAELCEKGLDYETARRELLKFMHGKRSEIISGLLRRST